MVKIEHINNTDKVQQNNNNNTDKEMSQRWQIYDMKVEFPPLSRPDQFKQVNFSKQM